MIWPYSSNRSAWPSNVGASAGAAGVWAGRLGHGFGFPFDHVARQHLTHHHVRVGTAEAEAGHPGQRVTAVARPVGGFGDHLQAHRVEVDVGAGAGEVDRRRQLVVLQGQHHLGHAGHPGRRLQVTDVGLDRPQKGRPIGRTPPADHPAQRLGLDRVTQDGAGAVRLDVVDGARIDAGVLVGPPQHLGLRVLVGGDQAVGPAVVVDRAAGDHGQDLVAVAAGVVHPLEHHHAAALGAGVAVGVRGERLDPPIGRQHRADLVETQRHHRRDQRVHPAGDHHVGLAVAQCLHALVDRHQRTRARRVDGDRRAAEVVEVRHPVGDDRAGGAGDGVGVRDRRVGDRQEAVVVGGAADEHADGLAAQARRRDAGVLERLPGQLQRHPLLRVDVVGLGLGHREELGVEALDVLQVAAPGAGVAHPLGQPRLFQEL